MEVARDRVQWRALVLAVLNLLFPLPESYNKKLYLQYLTINIMLIIIIIIIIIIICGGAFLD
jgi:hypothetical protein